MTGGTALALVDLQNDFCAGSVAAQRVTDDPTPLGAVAENAARAVALARAAGTEVLFVRFLSDPAHQGPSWRRRDLAQGRPASCVEGSWGAEFTGVAPGAGERVFTKRACFDAFLAEGFEAHLRARGVRRLVMAGLFADVCVDSTARTAFQKGFDITVLSDCTTSLHLPYPEVLRFMARFYGARIVEHRDPSWRAAAEEG